ncbi:hypothetical protein HPB51_006397 [Rhipicephalus microplus]|uniref:Uncharacterized protein n=1 Tax=Rhipicephalus microplus TaxID=6941 RepID=A0A9J6DZ16_RHIMP|nr:hypothetical protein HPB51_006397 [Rhipicephalus microplus]
MEGRLQNFKNEKFNAFNKRAMEFNCHRGCIKLGSRVVIHGPLRQRAMALTHVGHRGVITMKCARSYMWWPGIGKGTEIAAECTARHINQRAMRAPAPGWSRPITPWHTFLGKRKKDENSSDTPDSAPDAVSTRLEAMAARGRLGKRPDGKPSGAGPRAGSRADKMTDTQAAAFSFPDEGSGSVPVPSPRNVAQWLRVSSEMVTAIAVV